MDIIKFKNLNRCIPNMDKVNIEIFGDGLIFSNHIMRCCPVFLAQTGTAWMIVYQTHEFFRTSQSLYIKINLPFVRTRDQITDTETAIGPLVDCRPIFPRA